MVAVMLTASAGVGSETADSGLLLLFLGFDVSR